MLFMYCCPHITDQYQIIIIDTNTDMPDVLYFFVFVASNFSIFHLLKARVWQIRYRINCTVSDL